MRYIVANGATILRSGYAPDGSIQAGVGETTYIVEGGDGGLISDQNLEISEGALAAKPGYMGPVPEYSLVVE